MRPQFVDISEPRWQMRPARPEDASSIAALLNTVFGDWGDAATWVWKYKDPPAPLRLISAVAEVDGQLVGHYGIVPLSILYQGKQVRGAQAVDAAVLPEYRRQGILSSLAKLVLESAADAQASIIYAFPGLYSLNLNRQIGFQPVMIVPEMVRVLGAKSFFLDRLRSLPGDLRMLWCWRTQKTWSTDVIARLTRVRSSLLWIAAWMSAPVWQYNFPPGSIAVRKLEGFGQSFESFQAKKVLGLVKDCAYLSWRYCQHPDRAYLIWGAFEADHLVGYLVLHVAEFKSNICELEVLPGSENAIFALVEAAAHAAQEAGSLALGIWMTNHNPLHATLQKAGFISQHRLHKLAARHKRLSDQLYQIILYTRHLSEEAQKQFMDAREDWSLSMGDSDLV